MRSFMNSKSVACAVVLVLFCFLAFCGQEGGRQADKNKLYATCDNYFNIDQRQEWIEFENLLHRINELEIGQTYEIGCVFGYLESMQTQLSAYRTLDFCAPDEVKNHILPQNLSDAFNTYSIAREKFLEALWINQSVWMDPNTQFRAELPGLIQEFEKVNLALRQIRLSNDGATTAWYCQQLYDFSVQLESVAESLS